MDTGGNAQLREFAFKQEEGRARDEKDEGRASYLIKAVKRLNYVLKAQSTCYLKAKRRREGEGMEGKRMKGA